MLSLINSLKSLLKSSADLTKLEKTIFDAVKEKLRPPEAELWDAQIKSFNKVHRSPDNMEVNLYVISNGKSISPKELRFARTEEFKIAVVDVSTNEGKQKLRARVWCVDGYLFSIVYKTSFKVFEQAAQGDWNVHCHIENYPT